MSVREDIEDSQEVDEVHVASSYIPGSERLQQEIKSLRTLCYYLQENSDVPEISLMVEPFNGVAAAARRPPAGAALPHGTAAEVGATRGAITLGLTPVDSLDSPQSTSSTTAPRSLDPTSLPSLKQIQGARFLEKQGLKEVAAPRCCCEREQHFLN